jgi:hypothetical protein
LTEVAVTVTLPPLGMLAGAVYTVVEPLAVVTGEKLPQADPPHVTVHVTCGLADTSFVTRAPSGNCAPACSEAGGGVAKLTTIGIGPTMVIWAETDLVGSATEVAVTVTVLPLGMAAGALYVTAAALALGPKVPQAAALEQLTVHVTAVSPTVPTG